MKSRAGFTMMELLVVIAIVGILSAIAVPNFIGWRQNREFTTSVQRVISVMHSAKMHAVKENVPSVVSFDMGNQNFRAFIDHSNPNNYQWDPETDRLIDFYEMPPGVQMINDSTFSNNRISFNGRGLSNNGKLEITSDKGLKNTISVNIAGRIKVE